jgi:HPt (histidine-containing phosphotransfer) domain-containing protein
VAGLREEYLAAGMDDYVAKPIESTVLLDKLAQLGALTPAVPAATATDPNGDASIFDAAQFEMLANCMEAEELREFIGMYLEHSSGCASRVTAFAAAGDYAAIRPVAHELAGTAGNTGAVETHRIAKALVSACAAGDAASCQQLAAELPRATERAARWLQIWSVNRDQVAAASPALADGPG